MTEKRVNGLQAKLGRTFTSLLPKKEARTGECKRCGNCCQVEFLRVTFNCPFLSYEPNNLHKVYCRIYSFRPYQCREFPWTEKHRLKGCGYEFIGNALNNSCISYLSNE